MAIKQDNEITLKVTSTKEVLIETLITKGFKKIREFSMDDYYFIPENLDIKNMNVRDILSKAVLIRDIFDNNKYKKIITYKIKHFNIDGEILDQRAINCDIYNIEDGKNILKAIGFKEIMNIKENDTVYSKDNFELAIKDIVNGDILIEVETDSNYDTIDKLKLEVEKLKLPIAPNQYFIKKAEIELEKVLNKY